MCIRGKKSHGKENTLFIQDIPAANSLVGKTFLENVLWLCENWLLFDQIMNLLKNMFDLCKTSYKYAIFHLQ